MPVAGDIPAALAGSTQPTTVLQALAGRLRQAAYFTAGDQVQPCAILWTDPEQLWQPVLEDLKSLIPELFVLGPYDPTSHSGPALYLRCVEAGLSPDLPSGGPVPIFYLPGISRQRLREVEDCPLPLQPLIELQFRGAAWPHPNGKDWTPLAFLSSTPAGLGLEVSRDAATQAALALALPLLLREELADLSSARLDAAFLNHLLAPDLPSMLLRWMNAPDSTKTRQDASAWTAFCQQCADEYGFHPDKDGELRAAELLGTRAKAWAAVWTRFAEAPHRYLGVVELLGRADPGDRGQLALDPALWPRQNQAREQDLADALRALRDKGVQEAANRVHELEQAHGMRRTWVWAALRHSALAQALAPLDQLATGAIKPLAAGTAEELAQLYTASGWEVDAAVLASLACITRPEQEEPVITVVRALYLPWLEATARNLQLVRQPDPGLLGPRLPRIEAAPGRVILFADGLRFDLAQRLVRVLSAHGLGSRLDWDWAPIPGVTDTAKPYVSPIASLLAGGDLGQGFAPVIASTGKPLTTDRFRSLLQEQGIQVLEGLSAGDVTGTAWAETGGLDRRGHTEGWRLARLVGQELEDLAGRILSLLSAGWAEVQVVTDHGWLLMPEGLPRIDLPKFLTEERWGRCAVLKEQAAVYMPTATWYWSAGVTIASPPGIGCFKAGLEYSHGGISLQELVVPRILVRQAGPPPTAARIAAVKWTGMRCRVTVDHPGSGLCVDLRSRPADKDTSRVEGQAARPLAPDGTVSLPVADPADEGTAAVVVLLGPDGTILHSLATVVGGEG